MGGHEIMITIDTHVIIWEALRPDLITQRARTAIENANETDGTDDCRTIDVPLLAAANDCPNLQLRFEWPWSNNGEVAIDDIVVTGEVIVASIQGDDQGYYSTSITSCVDASIQLQCMFDNGTFPVQSDTIIVNFTP